MEQALRFSYCRTMKNGMLFQKANLDSALPPCEPQIRTK